MGLLGQRFKLVEEWMGNVGEGGTAGTWVVSEGEVGRTDNTEVKTGLGVGGTCSRECDCWGRLYLRRNWVRLIG